MKGIFCVGNKEDLELAEATIRKAISYVGQGEDSDAIGYLYDAIAVIGKVAKTQPSDKPEGYPFDL